MSYSDILKPRRDVLSEDGIDGIIDLANLGDPKKRKLEARPADFFALTYRVLAASMRDLRAGILILSGCRRDMRQEDSRWNQRNCPQPSLFPPR